MTKSNLNNREEKIQNIIRLITGEITPDDLKPKECCIKIGYGEKNIHLVNGKEVTQEYWDKSTKDVTEFRISYGDHDMDERESDED